MRHFTVTGSATAAFIAATQSPTSAGSRHQAGAEAALLHAIGRAADIEIDLVIAEIRADARALRQRVRIGAAELQGDRMLRRIEAEQPRAVAMQHRAGRDHLGVKQRTARQQAMERTGNAGRSIPSSARRKIARARLFRSLLVLHPFI